MFGVSAMLPVLAVAQSRSARGRFDGSPQSTPPSKHVDASTPRHRISPRQSPQSGLRVLAQRTVSAQPRRARAARHDRRGARRLRLQGAGRRDLRPRRQPAALLRALLRGVSLLVVRRADDVERAGARALGSRPDREYAVARARGRRSRRAALPGARRRAASRARRIGVPRLAVPHRLRDLLHADPAPRRSARPSRSSTSASIGWATRSAAVSSACCSCCRRRSQYSAILLGAVGVLGWSRSSSRASQPGYIQTLERSLLDRAVELDLSDVEDITTRTAVLRTLRRRSPPASPAIARPIDDGRDRSAAGRRPRGAWRSWRCKSRNRERVLSVLRRRRGPAAAADPARDPAARLGSGR